ncbi:Listeria/Bacterioides repeat [Candidatus Nanopelagicaceae bacterium]
MQQQAFAWLHAARAWTNKKRPGIHRLLVAALVAPLIVSVVPAANVAQAATSTTTAPQDISATANGTTLNVTWGAPAYGASTVTGYQVDYSTDGSTWTTSSSAIAPGTYSYGISGLTSGTSYYVRVAAKMGAATSPWAYPWTKLYGTTTPKRNSSNNIVYEPGYGLAAYGNQAANVYASSAFTRVRYKMQYVSNSGAKFNYVSADFDKWGTTTGNKYSSGATYTTPAASIATLAIPDATTTNLINASAANMTVESSDSTLNNHAVTGRLEIWANDYSQANGWSGGADGSTSVYDYNDSPNSGAAVSYGSFQVHDITNTKTVLAWNQHIYNNSVPDIGIGSNSACSVPDWTGCGATAGVNYYNTTNRDAWKLETFINVPTKMGSFGLLARYDAKQYASYTGSGNTWNDVSGNNINATLYNSLTSSAISNGSFNINSMQFNGTNQYATMAGKFNYDFSSGFSTTFYANFGSTRNNWERIIDFGNADANNNFVVAREGTTNNLWFEIFNNGASSLNIGSCKAVGAIDDNTWTHWGVVINGSTCAIYKNGDYWSGTTTTYVRSTGLTTNGTGGAVTFAALPVSNTDRANLYIGRSNWASDSYFEGGIADLALYNRPLSKGEVINLLTDQKATTVYADSSGTCATRVSNPTGVTVSTVANDCLIKFAAPGNATTSNKWIVPTNVSAARVLVVGGGGGGGAFIGGGGGAGGFIDTTTAVGPSTVVSISAGAGGSGASKVGGGTTTAANVGGNSTFGSLISAGGGTGSSYDTSNNRDGGSGGGGSASSGTYPTGGSALIAGQGNAGGSGLDCGSAYGYPTAGGGGAGAVGQNPYCPGYSSGRAGDGGVGKQSDISGTSTYFAGGGGGGGYNNGSWNYAIFAGYGGLGGGGNGAANGNGTNISGCPTAVTVIASNGTDGLGGGGGGAGAYASGSCNSTGGRGGSGVVYVRYGTTTLSISANNGSGFTGATSFTTSTYAYLTLPTQSGVARTGYTFAGWNTSANGKGTNYAAGSLYQALGSQTLYAQWNSVLSYNANGPVIGRVIDTTTALGSEASTVVNNGSVLTKGMVTSGLDLYLDASNARSYSGTGSTWYDLSGNGRNATAVGSPTFDSANGAFNFNGTSQYFDLGNTSLNYQGTQQYSFGAWIKTTAASKAEQCIICRYNAGGSFLFRLINKQVESYRTGQGSYQFTGLTVTTGTQYYVATTYDGTNINIFINGVRVYSAASGSMSFTSTINTFIGKSVENSDRYFQGQIGVVQAYNVALTDGQVLQNYNALLNKSYETYLPSTTNTKAGYTLTGWSTSPSDSSAVVSGASYATSLNALPTPNIRLKASDYNGTSWTPTNYNGAGISNWTTTAPTLNTNQTGWGTSATFSTVSGTVGNPIRLGNNTLPNYTFCAMAKWPVKGITLPSKNGRMFTGTDTNWLDGWYYGAVGNTHHVVDWNVNPSAVDYNWHYYCDTGNDIYLDGVKLTSTYRSYVSLPAISIGGGYWNGSTWADHVDYEFSEIIIYDQVLSSSQLDYINRYFKNTYGFESGSAGSPYASLNPVADFASPGNATLYAVWGSTITYDGNGATTGTAPATQVFQRSSGTLATNSGNLTVKGKSFTGWNTKADGTGTFYSVGASYTGPDLTLYAIYKAPVKIRGTISGTDPITLSPYMRFKASDYNATSKIWYDSSGNGRDTSYIKGAPTVATTTVGQNGSTKSFQTVVGATNATGASPDGVQFKNPTFADSQWTVFSVARLTTSQYSGSARLFDNESGNQLFGFYGNTSGVFHSGAWVTPWVSATANNIYSQNWVVSSGQTDYYKGIGYNGTIITSNTGTADGSTNTFTPLTINAGQYVGSDYSSGWAVAEVIMFDRKLTTSEMQQVQDYLASTYGVQGYSYQNTYLAPAVINAAANSVTVSDTYTAVLGYNNVLTVAPTLPGITLNTAIDSASLTIASTVAVGTYYETITATDLSGNTSTLPVQINVVNPLIWSAGNPTVISSTFGKPVRTRLDISGGYGTRVAGLAHTSSPAPRFVSIDTSTIASGYITLISDTATSVGTYTESITVTDGSNVKRTLLLTLIINSPPDIAYSSASDAEYPILTSDLFLNYDFSDTNSYSGTGTTITDLKGNAISGTITNAAMYSSGSGGNLSLNGTNRAVIRHAPIGATQSFSKFLWIYPTSNTGSLIAICDNTSCNSYHESEFELSGGVLYAAAYAAGTVNSGSTLVTTNQWHYVGFTWEYVNASLSYTKLYLDGKLVGSATTTGTRYAPTVEYNLLSVGDSTKLATATSGTFLLGAYHMYKSAITPDQVMGNYGNTKTRMLGISPISPSFSGRATVSMTEGQGSSYRVFSETSGTGTNTFALSGNNSAISLASVGTDQTSVVVSSSITANGNTAKTYYETLTATDSATAATAYYLTINVNPKIAITTFTDTLTTTFGKAAYDTITASYGTGTLTFTRTSGSASSAITAPVTGNQALLTAAATLPVGTYYETFTVTDSVSATTIKVITIIVNPALTLTSATGVNQLETTFSKAASLTINVANGTGTRTASALPVTISGVSLTTTNLQNGTMVLALNTAVAVGRYTETITVTDSVTSSTSIVITIIVNAAPTISYGGATSGALGFVTTKGGSIQSNAFTALNGTGTKTLALSGLNAGISIDTSTANSAVVTIGSAFGILDTQTVRTYFETLTATDSMSVSSTRSFTITLNPPIIETATSTSIATTSGIETSTVVYATKGSGDKTFTMSGNPTSGITLTSGTNQATLRVLSTINPGNYTVTVTATDTASATTSIVITIVVSPPPSMVGSSRIESTQGVLFKSPIYSISGGTGTLTMTVTNSPSNSNITLTGVTSTGGYLQIGTGSATGTFTSTIRVTDIRGAYSEIAVTVVVNAPVALTGSLSITKTYGTSTTNGYSTNGTGTSPFSFSATPVCAVVKTVSGSYTYEKINGTDSCTWTAPSGVTTVDALIVGAGGGGGGDGGSGGGGGSINTLSSVALPSNRQLSVQVGAGGTGGVWAGASAAAGGTTSIVSGSTTFTAPGGSGGGGCGAASAAGGTTGIGGSPTAGGASGSGASGACGAGTGAAGSAGPSTSFTGTATNFGGGGAGGPFPSNPTSVGGISGGAGGGGTAAISKNWASYGLTTSFKIGSSSTITTPANGNLGNATLKTAISGAEACATVTGNINYTTDTDFPCTSTANDYFQGYATGYFIAPFTGSITFYTASDDSSDLTITVGSTINELQLSDCCRTASATYTGFVQGQAYPFSAYFTEIGGGANWTISYSYTGQAQTVIPLSQFRSNAEGLATYFQTSGSAPTHAKNKTVISPGNCGSRVGNINFANDAAFSCTQKDNFQGYATGYFVAPYTGSIKFYMSSDDSSDFVITINGTNYELQQDIGDTSATYSGFVQGQYYPISAYFTEIGGIATWKLDYEYGNVARTAIPAAYFRSTMDFTAPTAGTNGLGGGGGAGSAGLFKANGASGGSGTAIIKYLTQSDTATETMITAYVNQESPSGLLTLNVPAYVTVGTYTETIKVQDAANSAPYSATVTITVNKATPTAALSLPGGVTTAKYGTPVILSVTASTPGNVAFKKAGTAISNCSSVATSNGVATCTWTPTVVETASVSAVLTPTDLVNYNNSIETVSALSIVVSPADTLTVTAGNLNATYSESSGTANTTIPTRTFTLDGLATLAGDSITAVTYNFAGTINGGTSYPSSTTTPKLAGTYSITPSSPVFSSGATTNYKSVVYTAGTLTINRAARGTWSINYGTSNVIRYGAGKTETPTATFSGDGSASYTTSSSVCSVSNSGTITTLGVGACDLQIVLSHTNNWLSDTKTVTVTINRGLRTSTITPALTTIKYGETTTVTSTVSPALDSATVTFSSNGSLGCAVDNITGLLTGIKASTACSVRVTYDQTALYESATATASIAINKALAPVVTTDSITAVSYTGLTAIVTPTYKVTGILARDISQILPLADVSTTSAISVIAPNTYTSVSSYRYFATNPTAYDSTTAPSLGGTYAVYPQSLTLLGGLDIGNYETPTYVSSNFTILPIAQEPLRIQLSYLESVTVPFDVTTTGGSSTGARTLAILDGGTATGCAVDSGISAMRLKTSTAGTCVIQVTQAADRNYLVAVSDSQTVNILNFVVNILQLFDNPTGIVINHDVPYVKGPDVCTADCQPTITQITDANGVDITTMTVSTSFRIIGTNFTTATGVFFTAVIGGSRKSAVPADSFQIDSDTQITVMPPVTFVPNAGETISNITVRIYVVASGGQNFPNTMITAISL